MTRLTDDELQRSLSRRVNRQPLSLDERRQLLSAMSARTRNGRRPVHLFGWPFTRVASAAAAVVVLFVGAVLLPGLVRLPGPVGAPGTASPTPSAALPTAPRGDVALRIYTPSEASDLAADPANQGRVVIVALDPRWPCPGDTSCEEAGFIVVRLDGDAAHVGGVRLLEGAKPWTVTDVLESSRRPRLGLIAVDAWLGRVPFHPCASSMRVECGDEAYLTPSSTPVARPANGGWTLQPDGALVVQAGAYEEFADQPLVDGEGFWAPRRGIYLLRPGCARVRSLCASDWEVVARIEPPLAHAVELTPSTSPSGSQHEILGAVAEWLSQDDRLGTQATLNFLTTVATDDRWLGDPFPEWGPPVFDGPMTSATIAAIAAELGPIEGVSLADVGPAICRVGRDTDRPIIEFGPIRAGAAGEHYLVQILVSEGCRTSWLEVSSTDDGYLVTREVASGQIID